ncbi:MAG: diguanylate cyclase [Acidobacteria bacterium]|nr:diguanylate cyclase [Acidobacteriota bacterium]NIM60376.1 diguanylate cyclase [Acidobacteriota bacterium]NIO60311.1 diguanylate cyclase [Acidobacteriota bacterium]NIQ31366.1 diguanylate cyclase [Acidobacteriota bacterium]NIQ86589.1 diguanylate cyclase [Acidobacteriota bacterium]
MAPTTTSRIDAGADPMKDLELAEALSDLLYRSDPAVGGLDSQLLDLHSKHGDGIYSELIFLLSHLRFDSTEAKHHWQKIAEHRKSLEQRLESPVDLRVALLSYFVDVSRKLSNPKIMELKLFEETQASLYRDELTGLCNFRYFRDHLTRELRRADRYNQLLSLVMMDVDDFKSYNDEHGHDQGNEALATVARLLAESLRTIDVPARYGGEEFAFILPTTPKADAHLVAERARARIEEHVFSQKGTPRGTRLTVSMGVATFPSDASTAEDLIRHADSALYVAKTLGKNQVHLYGHCRRSYVRVETALEGRLRLLADVEHPFTAVNLSERGLLLHLGEEMKDGTLLELQLELPGSKREIGLSGRVTRVKPLETGKFETAIRVVEMPPREQRQMAEYIRAKEAEEAEEEEPATVGS